MFKDNLRLLRKSMNMTQLELSKLLNVSNKTLSHWEQGYTEPNINTLVQLKKLLNVTYEELLE